jgi:hypothetical protein
MAVMRRLAAAFLLLALVSCASSSSGGRQRLVIQVFGPRAAQITGPQAFLVRITNLSSENVLIHTIRVDFASSGSAFEMVDNVTTIDEEITAGQSADYELTPQVIGGRGDISMRPASGRIDALRVDVNGQTAAGAFYDGGTYPVVTR